MLFMPIIKDPIYIDLLEAYEPQGISTNVHDIWIFEHAALKNAKILQSFLWSGYLFSDSFLNVI